MRLEPGTLYTRELLDAWGGQIQSTLGFLLLLFLCAVLGAGVGILAARLTWWLRHRGENRP